MDNTPKEYSQELLVHFDTIEHFVSVEEFCKTAETVDQLAHILNRQLFHESIKFTTYVKPPEKGGFQEIFNFLSAHGPDIVVGVVAQPLIDAFLEETTGKDLKESFKSIIRGTINNVQAIPKDIHHDVTISIPFALKLLAELTRGYMTKKPLEIQQIDPKNMIGFDASKIKTQFYTMCAKSGRIKGIGFSREHNFPIKQSDFIKQVVADPIETDVIQKRYELHEVTIIAPVNVQDSQVQWKTKDKHTDKRVSFLMADDKFRKEFFGGLYPLKETKKDDEMLVYVEYTTIIHPNGKKSDKRQAIKVFRFNDKDIDPVPEGIKLNTPNLTADPRQGTLFNMREIGTKKVNL